ATLQPFASRGSPAARGGVHPVLHRHHRRPRAGGDGGAEHVGVLHPPWCRLRGRGYIGRAAVRRRPGGAHRDRRAIGPGDSGPRVRGRRRGLQAPARCRAPRRGGGCGDVRRRSRQPGRPRAGAGRAARLRTAKRRRHGVRRGQGDAGDPAELRGRLRPAHRGRVRRCAPGLPAAGGQPGDRRVLRPIRPGSAPVQLDRNPLIHLSRAGTAGRVLRRQTGQEWSVSPAANAGSAPAGGPLAV
ncbi:MAG: hypothetical protein AVDCRST_MAG89-2483, partial [uncultured Gemmatimonadetes bacterium]